MLSKFGSLAPARVLRSMLVALCLIAAVARPARAEDAAPAPVKVDVFSYEKKTDKGVLVGYYTDEAAAAADKENANAKTINNGDVAWMLTSAALVLMMTGPGLAL